MATTSASSSAVAALRSPALVRAVGLATTALYAAFIVWVYAAQPRSLVEMRGGVAASIGVYAVDAVAFDEGVRYFRADKFAEARRAFGRADAAERDPKTQFYIAYTFLRQGWGRFYEDDALYAQGQGALQRALAASSGGVIRVDDDPNLTIKSSDELAEAFARGLKRDVSDLNPLGVLEKRP